MFVPLEIHLCTIVVHSLLFLPHGSHIFSKKIFSYFASTVLTPIYVEPSCWQSERLSNDSCRAMWEKNYVLIFVKDEKWIDWMKSCMNDDPKLQQLWIYPSTLAQYALNILKSFIYIGNGATHKSIQFIHSSSFLIAYNLLHSHSHRNEVNSDLDRFSKYVTGTHLD